MRSILIALPLLFLACTGQQTTVVHTGNSVPQPSRRFTGTVQYIELEGGFYGIVTDTGDKLLPGSLPQDLAVHGQAVRGIYQPDQGRMGIHMWGEHIDLIIIERNDAECGMQ